MLDVDALTAAMETSYGIVAHRQPLQDEGPPPSVLISEPVWRRASARSQLGEVLFERFKAPRIAFSNTAALSACAFGVLNAMVVDVGAGLSFVAPVVDGRTRAEQVGAAPFAGQALDSALHEALKEQGVTLKASGCCSAQRLAQDLKEAVCFCSHKPLATMEPADAFFHTLPDGQRLDAAAFSRMVPEQLLTGSAPNFVGLPALYSETVGACQRQGVPHLPDVLLVGGSSLFVNFKKRFEAALASLPRIRPGRTKFQVHSSRERRHAAWLGGSVLASAGCAEWIRLDDYQEQGSSLLQEKFR